jgi:site-specific DNA-methyltransferase (adenine-specific)
VLARKPLSERTVASNVLRWGTGALNIDGCRVEATDQDALAANWDRMQSTAQSTIATALAPKQQIYKKEGRWPANVILDSSDEVVSAFPESDHARGNIGDSKGGGGMYGHDLCTNDFGAGDEGSAARFFYQVKQDDPCANRLFYTSKADSDDRIGSKHPTVKPLDLMQYLVRLVTPKGGLVLDPFAGSGTTGEAAYREGMRAVLIECEAEYLKDIERRIELLMSGPDERAFKSQKARQNGKPMDAGPLFGGKSDWDEMWTRPFERPELL